MATKAIRLMDPQGRIFLPSQIRKELKLDAGTAVEVTIEDDNTIRIKPAQKRCAICESLIESVGGVTIAEGKHICTKCARKIIKAMESQK